MQNNYRFKLSPKADRDLDKTYRYIFLELKNPKAADDLIDDFQKAFVNLEYFPESCPLSHNPVLRQKGYRVLVVNNYIALYKIDPKRKLVIIMHIFYGAMDYEKLV